MAQNAQTLFRNDRKQDLCVLSLMVLAILYFIQIKRPLKLRQREEV